MEEEAYFILRKLNEHQYEAYFVGGYPRDRYLNRICLDIDICTSATPKEISKIFPDSDLRFSNYGVVLFNHHNYSFEITTFRRDLCYRDHRKPSVEFVTTLEEDLKRRDFVINTLCIDQKGQYIDLLGAKEDLDRRYIRTVGDSFIKIEQDALRILRAIRFAVLLDFKLDNSLQQAIRKYKYLLKDLSYERKKRELHPIFDKKYRSRAIQLLKKMELEYFLDLDFSKGDENESIYCFWFHVDIFKQYPFTKEERRKMPK